jgi:hypothetical protein
MDKHQRLREMILIALESLKGESQPQPFDPYPEEGFDAAAHKAAEAGDIEIIRQEGKDAMWKLTPLGTLKADLLNIIDWKRWERLLRLSESEEDANEHTRLAHEILEDIAPAFLMLAEGGLFHVVDLKDSLLLCVRVKPARDHTQA